MAYGTSKVESLEPGTVRDLLESHLAHLWRESPEGADFLVAAFVHALRSYRRPTVCAPFPTALFNKGTECPEKDFSSAEDCIAYFTHLHRLSPGQQILPDSTELNNPLKEMPLRALKLLEWILGFKRRVCLLKNPSEELARVFPGCNLPLGGHSLSKSSRREGLARIEELRPHYVLKIGSPEISTRNEKDTFENARTKHGSFVAFHGTAAENIHCILRCGLINLSGTRQQRNGAIFGDGIYLSTDPAVGLSFCSAGEGWARSCFGARARYLLLCEVANGPGVARSNKSEGCYSSSVDFHPQEPTPEMRPIDSPGTPAAYEGAADEHALGTYILVQNSDLIRVRYIFVYSEPSRATQSLDDIPGSWRSWVSTVSGRGGLQSLLPNQHPARRLDWCTILIVAYVAVLIGVGFLRSDAYRHGIRPAFLTQPQP